MNSCNEHHNGHSGTALYCNCCEKKKMAVLYPTVGLEIRDDRHTLSVGPQELMERLAGTIGSDGVLNYVRAIFR